MMSTKISGIMYDKARPSAIINVGGVDQLVHKGDGVRTRTAVPEAKRNESRMSFLNLGGGASGGQNGRFDGTGIVFHGPVSGQQHVFPACNRAVGAQTVIFSVVS